MFDWSFEMGRVKPVKPVKPQDVFLISFVDPHDFAWWIWLIPSNTHSGRVHPFHRLRPVGQWGWPWVTQDPHLLRAETSQRREQFHPHRELQRAWPPRKHRAGGKTKCRFNGVEREEMGRDGKRWEGEVAWEADRCWGDWDRLGPAVHKTQF